MLMLQGARLNMDSQAQVGEDVCVCVRGGGRRVCVCGGGVSTVAGDGLFDNMLRQLAQKQ